MKKNIAKIADDMLLTIFQFKKCCDEVTPVEIEFLSDYQNFPNNDTCMIKLRFDSMTVMSNPNIVQLNSCRKNLFGKYNSYIRISQIKYIKFVDFYDGKNHFKLISIDSNGNEVEYNIGIYCDNFFNYEEILLKK